MRKKTLTTSIGAINLNNIEFCENTLDVFIGIESVSEEIQQKINAAVETAKAKRLQFIEEYCVNKNLKWTDAGVDMNLYLHIKVDNKAFLYQISIDITDREEERMWADASIEVDLSEYHNELKKVIVKAMIDKFF